MADSDADRLDAAPGATSTPPTETGGAASDNAATPSRSSQPSDAWATPECGKCGAMLPEGDEGICPMCGTPFGFLTGEMAAVPPEVLAQRGFASQISEVGSANQQAIAQRAARRARKTAVIVLAIAALLAAVLVVVVLTSR